MNEQFDALIDRLEIQDQRLDEFQAQIFMICVALILVLPAVVFIK